MEALHGALWYATTVIKKDISLEIVQSLGKRDEWEVVEEVLEWGVLIVVVVHMERQEEMERAVLYAIIAISLDTWQEIVHCLERNVHHWFAIIAVLRVTFQEIVQSQERSAE